MHRIIYNLIEGYNLYYKSKLINQFPISEKEANYIKSLDCIYKKMNNTQEKIYTKDIKFVNCVVF